MYLTFSPAVVAPWFPRSVYVLECSIYVSATVWVQNFVWLKFCIFAETSLLLNFQRF